MSLPPNMSRGAIGYDSLTPLLFSLKHKLCSVFFVLSFDLMSLLSLTSLMLSVATSGSTNPLVSYVLFP